MIRAALPKTCGEEDPDSLQRRRIVVAGRVQGVGFRPFVYRLATELNLSGTVCNDLTGLQIEIQGPGTQVARFQQALATSRPPLAEVSSVSVTTIRPVPESGFGITTSRSSGDSVTLVPPDAAICENCRQEIFDPENRRHRYPFTNCTDCGPRFSIIEGLPYDRARTTMRHFTMCERCREEYDNPADRRFHAQPNACPDCGPQLALWNADSVTLMLGDDALRQTAAAVRDGAIVALKGLGGFQLMVDARNREAVRRLRDRKNRPDKPLAVMYPSLELVRRDCRVSELEAGWLNSAAAPIILLERMAGTESTDAPCDLIASNNRSLGVMLPYTPLHLLLMTDLGIPVVATSGNPGGEPICIDEYEAVRKLGTIADLFLVHNRPIARQVDDSVIRMVHDHPVVIRLGRGLAPVALQTRPDFPSILATGGHQKNAFAFSSGPQILLSQHIGDLDSPASRDALHDNMRGLTSLYRTEPKAVACDLHPDYASTRVARSRSEHPIRIQHHLAHILACMAEHHLTGPVLGVAWDGFGLGENSELWGGEFIEVRPGAHTRVAHLRPFRLPGGEKAVLEPRRSALGLLQAVYGSEFADRLPKTVRSQFSSTELGVMTQLLKRGSRCPYTTSAGRLFDAFSSLLDLCHSISYEGQAAVALEQAADSAAEPAPYPFTVTPESPIVLDWQPMVEAMLSDIRHARPVSIMARRIHATLARMIAEVAVGTAATTVALSGGCFQNALLLSLCAEKLEYLGISVVWPQRTPINDGGLAVGQVLAAARHLERRP